MAQIPVESIIEKYLQKIATTVFNDNVSMSRHTPSPDSGWPEDGLVYRTDCKKCSVYEMTAATDWSDGGGLDFLLGRMIEFGQLHKHEPDGQPERVFRLD